jgi:hypothetical protein
MALVFFIGRCGVYACHETHRDAPARRRRRGTAGAPDPAAPAVIGRTTLAVDGHLSVPADGSPSSTSFALPRDVRPPRGELVDFAEDDGSISFRKWWCGVGTRGHASRVAKTKYEVNPAAARRARELIDARQYVLNSDWGQVQPDADAQNRYLESHSWDDYGRWHLALTTGVADERKARYAFVFGDFRRLHRTALIACVYRASEWRHKSVELAAHDLLQYLDAKTM